MQRLGLTNQPYVTNAVAPEVGLGLPYNESCDTYSFSIMLWQLMCLERPWGVMSPTDLKRQIWLDQKRPDSITSTNRRCLPCRCPRAYQRSKLSPSLQSLVEKGWSANPNERPPMNAVEAILKKECIECTNEDLSTSSATIGYAPEPSREIRSTQKGKSDQMKLINFR